MKTSQYNIKVRTSKEIICYNTVSNYYVYLSEQEYNQIFGSEKISEANINSDNAQLLIDHGFLVPDDKDEYKELCDEYNKAVNDSPTYELTLLPSLDCNLRCWYCFEKHIQGSHLDCKMQNAIFNHVKNTFSSNASLEHLSVELFGGEPLLYFDEELYPLLLKIKDYIENIGKTVSFFFVTNGVCIENRHFPLFQNLHAGFQISIDGYKEKHDKVKYMPQTHVGTYNKVMETIKDLTANIEDVFINLRINYDDNTLFHIDEIIKDLIDVDRNKIRIHLERVWQTTDKRQEANPILKNVINLLIVNGFNVSYMNLHRRSVSCKSSQRRQSVLSYDGKVYKCTGRDFSDEMVEGYLQQDGKIKWNEEKLSKRLGIVTYDNHLCKACKFLPQCWGPCNQKLLEDKNIERFCQLKLMELSLDDYIIYGFNNNLKQKQRCEGESQT